MKEAYSAQCYAVKHTILLILQDCRPQFAPLSAYPRSVRCVTLLPEEVVDMLTPVIRTLVLLSIQLESNIFN